MGVVQPLAKRRRIDLRAEDVDRVCREGVPESSPPRGLPRHDRGEVAEVRVQVLEAASPRLARDPCGQLRDGLVRRGVEPNDLRSERRHDDLLVFGPWRAQREDDRREPGGLVRPQLVHDEGLRQSRKDLEHVAHPE
ncbi:MAG: hypothetical protein R3F16_08785 [Myxococcota bacterium]